MSTPHTLRQPVYRRPSWAQRDKSYEHYMRKDLAIDRSPGHDFGMENFSYDEAHLSKWQMPKDLQDSLPSELRDTATDWQYAGAALCTSLDRLAKLDHESLHRAYPEKSLSHLSRVNSMTTAASGAGMDTPPLSSSVSPTHMALKSSLLPLEKLSQLNDSVTPRQILGMETPPFTPVDSQVCPTPEFQGDTPAVTSPMPDVHQLSRHLSREARTDSVTGAYMKEAAVPQSGKSQVTGSFSSIMSDTSSTRSGPAFDEAAWETFLNAYKAELQDTRSNAWVRLKGCGYTVDKLRVEKGSESEWHAVVEKFNGWWSSMKPQLAAYEEKVKQLEAPTIELVRMERLAKGLSV
ncbi:uncharacterized protein MYCFIDRAFT_195766 [Pseudocercospora fijiensis CIRAD86]|uniref:Uncharacterized protein n=1 Tax=Pseudocercospora fijiensis (strain CIRAD86) TaxID=383855 RepID=M2Z4U3_PSEFD|nr:uncharacterized protein MYCFIDRAFT_195766 [Pseudocercospora fijiensis CIRAD86]EME84815.1 hypothetical protein MYCFIDRAFT_195766 [Pseudocercospora fijiensis CIRAD86]